MVVILSTPYCVALCEQAKNRRCSSPISALALWIAGRSPRQSGALAPHSTTLARSAEYHAEAPQFWSPPRQRRFAPVAGEKEEAEPPTRDLNDKRCPYCADTRRFLPC